MLGGVVAAIQLVKAFKQIKEAERLADEAPEGETSDERKERKKQAGKMMVGALAGGMGGLGGVGVKVPAEIKTAMKAASIATDPGGYALGEGLKGAEKELTKNKPKQTKIRSKPNLLSGTIGTPASWLSPESAVQWDPEKKQFVDTAGFIPKLIRWARGDEYNQATKANIGLQSSGMLEEQRSKLRREEAEEAGARDVENLWRTQDATTRRALEVQRAAQGFETERDARVRAEKLQDAQDAVNAIKGDDQMMGWLANNDVPVGALTPQTLGLYSNLITEAVAQTGYAKRATEANRAAMERGLAIARLENDLANERDIVLGQGQALYNRKTGKGILNRGFKEVDVYGVDPLTQKPGKIGTKIVPAGLEEANVEKDFTGTQIPQDVKIRAGVTAGDEQIGIPEPTGITTKPSPSLGYLSGLVGPVKPTAKPDMGIPQALLPYISGNAPFNQWRSVAAQNLAKELSKYQGRLKGLGVTTRPGLAPQYPTSIKLAVPNYGNMPSFGKPGYSTSLQDVPISLEGMQRMKTEVEGKEGLLEKLNKIYELQRILEAYGD